MGGSSAAINSICELGQVGVVPETEGKTSMTRYRLMSANSYVGDEWSEASQHSQLEALDKLDLVLEPSHDGENDYFFSDRRDSDEVRDWIHESAHGSSSFVQNSSSLDSDPVITI